MSNKDHDGLPLCSVCSRVATEAVRDLAEMPGEDGQVVMQPASEWRYGCSWHKPAGSLLFRLGGYVVPPIPEIARIVIGWQQMRQQDEEVGDGQNAEI